MAIDSTYNDVLNDEIKYYWIGHTKQFDSTRVCTDTLENAIEYAKRSQPNYRPFYIIKAVTHFEIVGIVNKYGKFQSRTLKSKQLPPAQPKIIRCEDCMHNGSFDTDCPIGWNGKEYCSFAERWEDGSEFYADVERKN